MTTKGHRVPIWTRMTRLGRLRWLMLLVLFAAGVILLFAAGSHPEGVVDSVLREAGIVTIGTVLVSLVYEFVLRPEHDTHLLDVVQDSLIARAGHYGLSGIERLDAPDLFRKLGASDELYWLDTHCPNLENADVRSALVTALEKGARVRLLVIDPECDTAQARAQEIVTRAYQPDAFQQDARNGLALVLECRRDLSKEQADRLEVRTYSGLPSAPMYLHLRSGHPYEGWTSYYLSWPTYETAHFYWRSPRETAKPLPAGDGLGLAAVKTYFELKWAPAAPEGASRPAGPEATSVLTELQDGFAELRTKHYALVIALIERDIREAVLKPMREALTDGRLHRGQNATTRRLLLDMAEGSEVWLVHSTSENLIFTDSAFWRPFFEQLKEGVATGSLLGVRRLFIMEDDDDPTRDAVLTDQIAYHDRTGGFSYRLLSRREYNGIQRDERGASQEIHDFGIYGEVAYVWQRSGYARRFDRTTGYFEVDPPAVDEYRVLHRRCWEAGVALAEWRAAGSTS